MVTVRSEDPQAKIYIDNNYIGTGMGVMDVPKAGRHTIKVTKDQCGDGAQAITKSFDARSLLGIFIDLGIITIFVIDWAATGAVSDIEPRYYTVNPTCAVAKAPAQTEPPTL